MEFTTATFDARVELLDDVTSFIEERSDLFGLDIKRKMGLLVAIEEAFVNVCNHAYPKGSGQVKFSCGWESDLFVVEIADSGKPFDMLSLPEPDTTSDIMEREVGGLGVYFIRKFCDEIYYRRENENNIVRLVVRHRSGQD